MEHEPWFEPISAAVDGQLGSDERAELDAHLASCPTCADLHRRMDRERRQLRIHAHHRPNPDLLASVLATRTDERVRAQAVRARLMRRGGVVAGLVAASMIALMTLARTPAPPSVPAPSLARDQVLIDAQSHAFEHADVEVTVGTTVEWRNAGATRHKLVRTFGGATVTEDLLPGHSEVAEFSEPGVYRFSCSIHPEMTGSVTVDA